MQEVDPEYYKTEEFLLSKVTITNAEIQYRGYIVVSEVLCSLFKAITGMSVDDAEQLRGERLDEFMKSATPDKTLFHLVGFIREVSKDGESIGKLLRRECSH